MTLNGHEDEPYSNKFQKQAVEFLHRRIKTTAIVACNNSTIDAYLTRDSVTAMSHEMGPYEIDRVKPLPNCSEFECKVTFNADWGEVDLEEDELTADWLTDDE